MKSYLSGIMIFVSLISILSCSTKIKGEFGWSSTDDRGLNNPELSLLVEDEFHYSRSNIYFYNYETIWWVYMIEKGSYDDEGFLASLYENNLSPEPVEIELRHVRVQKSGFSRGFIRQKYDPLNPGNYLLRIAYKSRIVDEVEFHVVPPDGAHSVNEEDEIPVFDKRDTEDEDEIMKFSS